MRRALRIVVLALLVCAAFPAQEASAIYHNCDNVNCGFRCQVFGNFAGYCLWTEVQTTGCVQYIGPYCASMLNAYCCTGERDEF